MISNYSNFLHMLKKKMIYLSDFLHNYLKFPFLETINSKISLKGPSSGMHHFRDDLDKYFTYYLIQASQY